MTNHDIINQNSITSFEKKMEKMIIFYLIQNNHQHILLLCEHIKLLDYVKCNTY